MILRICFALLLSHLVNGENILQVPHDGIMTEEDIPGLNVSSCDAPSCGSKMASFNGVPAKSNGNYQCGGGCCGGSVSTGCAYQCVELAQRYFHEKFGTPKIWDNIAYAKQMCSNRPPGVKKTSNPQPGDLWVRSSGTYGHVAVITAVHSSKVDVIEQNSSPSGKNTYAKSDAACFLTAQENLPEGICSHKGYYCGDDGLQKSANNLFYCADKGAEAVLSEKCEHTCVTEPSGQDDQCAKDGTCEKVITGYYCGDDKVDGDKNNLYYCKDSHMHGAVKCENGCKIAPSGQDDYCK
jgi:surface antigen